MKTSYSSNFRCTSVIYDVFPVTSLRLISPLILNLLLVIVNDKMYYILGKYLRNAFNGAGLQKRRVRREHYLKIYYFYIKYRNLQNLQFKGPVRIVSRRELA